MLNKALRKLGQAAGLVGTIAISNPIQGGLLVINYFLFRSAIRALKRARFVASVRVIKDLRTEEDLRYILGHLPPWVSSPDWERGDTVQVLLALLWPSLNSFVCTLLRRELEERVQESSDFGHISFSRLSFGKHPPVIVGIKAVPLQGEDLLAMVLDVDIRWAGEPDIALHLTKLGGASLGLADVHLAGVVRLVFSPITEDPPFLRHMSISLLNRPYVDFSVRALGGPDLMSLPAISDWLHAVVLNLADKAIVWPRDIGIRLGPAPATEAAQATAAEAAAQLPPLGVLVVRVVSAEIEPRRSTFLGRLKLPSPRVSLVLPEATGGTEEGVMQAGLTTVREKTLNPEWNAQFNFVVSRPSQKLRLLLSHKRMDLLGADAPLGLVDLPLEDILDDYDAEQERKAVASGKQPRSRGAAVVLPSIKVLLGGTGPSSSYSSAFAKNSNSNQVGGGWNSNASRVASKLGESAGNGPSKAQRQRSRSPTAHVPSSSAAFLSSLSFENDSTNRDLLNGLLEDRDDGYHSATSTLATSRSISPARSHTSSSVPWASPLATLRSTPSMGTRGMPVRSRSVNWLSNLPHQTSTMSELSTGSGGEASSQGRGLSLLLSAAPVAEPTPIWTPPRAASFPPPGVSGSFSGLKAHRLPRSYPSPGPLPLSVSKRRLEKGARAGDAATSGTAGGRGSSIIDDEEEESSERQSWLTPEGIFIQISSTTSMTMAGMVSNAAEADASGVRTGAHGNGAPRTDTLLGRMASGSGAALGNATAEGGEVLHEEEHGRGWFKSLQALVLGNTLGEDAESDEEREIESVGKVKLVVKWLPVALANDPSFTNDGGVLEGSEAGSSQALGSLEGRGIRVSLDNTELEKTKNTSSKRMSLDHKRSGSAAAVDSAAESPSRQQSEAGSEAPTPRRRSSAMFEAISSNIRPAPPLVSHAGVLAIRVAYTKVDYGDSPGNPILALSVGLNPATSVGSLSAAAAAAAPPHRLVCLECQAGGRPGLLHWGRVFHIPVWNPVASRALLELGEAASALKLSSYGAELYALDACADFESDVAVEAAASIPLKDVVSKGVVKGTWRLREARRGRLGPAGVGVVGVGVAGDEHEHLDVGRAALVMAWFPLA